MACSVLVVEDDQHIRQLLRLEMERCGYACETAIDGSDAIRELTTRAYDLVISDIVMPNSDGLEVIMFIRKNQLHTKIIAVRAPGNELDLSCATGIGASRVFPKPFKLTDIARAAE